MSYPFGPVPASLWTDCPTFDPEVVVAAADAAMCRKRGGHCQAVLSDPIPSRR
jgi:hypothetical protein